MTRKALIISNPGELGEDYCAGVLEDVKNYKKYLTSKAGGGWFESEIHTMNKPTSSDVTEYIQGLSNIDYSFIVFTGHGYVKQSTNRVMLELSKGQTLDESDLRKSAKKRSIILDCCREVYDKFGNKVTVESFSDKYAYTKNQSSMLASLNEHRVYFEKVIAGCSNDIVVLHSCKKGQTSKDDEEEGGYYSSNLLATGASWASGKAQTINPNTYRTSSIISTHNSAKEKTMKKSEGTQTPYAEKPRSSPYFPFSIVVSN